MPFDSGDIVFEMKTLDSLLKKRGEHYIRNAIGDDESLTRMHHWIIAYLYNRQDTDTYQRDIESYFRISRSTTSSMLSLMEKKGLLTRASVDLDARLKKITLTEKAKEMHARLENTFIQLDRFVEESITPEEKREFLRIIDKIRRRVKADMEQNNIPFENIPGKLD